MFEPTGSQRDAASTIFNLSDYRVIDALEVAGHARRVEVDSTSPPGCPTCGVVSVRVHSRRRQRIRDVPVAGSLEVIWCKRRWFCDEWKCGRGTFAESTLQVPPRARSTVRLRTQLVATVIESGRAVSETARAHGVSWWLVQSAVTMAALLPTVGAVAVKKLGVDEHRYRSVRFYRTETGAWARYEPWMSTIVDVTTGQVLGIVDGRGSAGVGAWLAARPIEWLAQVEVVAIDPSAAFRKAIRTHLPCAAVSIDTFHLVKLGNDALTAVRQRLVRDHKGRRGRLVDPACPPLDCGVIKHRDTGRRDPTGLGRSAAAYRTPSGPEHGTPPCPGKCRAVRGLWPIRVTHHRQPRLCQSSRDVVRKHGALLSDGVFPTR